MSEFHKVVVGQDEMIERVFIGLLCGLESQDEGVFELPASTARDQQREPERSASRAVAALSGRRNMRSHPRSGATPTRARAQCWPGGRRRSPKTSDPPATLPAAVRGVENRVFGAGADDRAVAGRDPDDSQASGQ
jgi:hypothetical protein